MLSLPDGLDWVDVRDKWNFDFRAEFQCTEKIHCRYMYIWVRVPSKKKKWGMSGTDIYFIFSIKQILDRIRWGAPFIFKLGILYTSFAVWNRLSQGQSTLRPFRSLVKLEEKIKCYMYILLINIEWDEKLIFLFKKFILV